MFLDTVTIHLRAGKGGDGAIRWRREKFIPKGGPAGGDGGKGGSIMLQADPELVSLQHLRNRRIIKAQNGQGGGSNNCTGKDGEDLILKVPLGTLVKDAETKNLLFDFKQEGESWTICSGGIGGKGNSRFKSSTNQAPAIFTKGRPGEEAEVELELKLIADVGLVGMPNAGKSTLISQLAHVHVKIAPYPFTTLQPNLGMMKIGQQRILLADIPGLIQGAHLGKGRGFEFLRHIERTRFLLYVLELSPFEEERDPVKEFLALRKELQAYQPALLSKPFLVALNKVDLPGAEKLCSTFRLRYPFSSSTLFEISAREGQGCEALKGALGKLFAIPFEVPSEREDDDLLKIESLLLESNASTLD